MINGEWDLARVERWLREPDEGRLEELYRQADAVRREQVGDAVFLRGLIEFSNYCRRSCAYCGLRAENEEVARYRMEAGEILACAQEAKRLGYGTVVLQAGEDPQTTREFLGGVIEQICAQTGLTVTLSVGERSREDLAAWFAAGARRYLLRFETSNPALYARIHPTPAGVGRDRFTVLRDLRELGYEVGSGALIGIPGQTYADLAADILLFRELDLDMIGCGPWIAHLQTPLATFPPAAEGEQVPGDESMTYKVIALARLLCPGANIPATTALATLNKDTGRENGLRRGANILMPNCTPRKYRSMYEIYPAKVCIDETAVACRGCMGRRIHAIGRTIGAGPGSSGNLGRRLAAGREIGADRSGSQ